MINAILGIKLGQTQRFTSQGVRIPVTQIQTGPCVVVCVKTKDKDGYWAVQLGFGSRKEKSLKKPILGHFKKAGAKITPRFLREVRLESEENLKPGEELRVEQILKPGDLVNIIGISKGKGFAGVVKRWGFAGGPKTHGQSDRERAPGSIGSTTTPGRVLKGKKMAGRMGQERVTIKNLLVTDIDLEKNLLMVKGLVPGAKGGLLIIEKAGEDKKFVKMQAKPEEVVKTTEADEQENEEKEIREGEK